MVFIYRKFGVIALNTVKKKKIRLDMLLVERGLFPSREKARAAIMAGEILVNEIKIDKAGTAVDEQSDIRIIGKRLPFVSRGGLKLQKAIEVFGIDFNDLTVIDIGASTGGFTDCALQHGAKKVYAIDVGHNQLAWPLRNDDRVIVMEKTNARYLDKEILNDDADILVADVSFISLTLGMPAAIKNHLKPYGHVMCLIKPQFEAGRDAVGKGGIVRDPSIHYQVIEKIITAFAELDLSVQALDYSPITGADGNIEYLIYAQKCGITQNVDINAVIKSAWAEHRNKEQ